MDPALFYSELQFRVSRSGGAGGQNVNKVETKVEARLHIENSQLFTDLEKELILQKCAGKIDGQGYLSVTSQTERTQLGNKRKAVLRLQELVEKALIVQAPRKKKGISKAAKEKRLMEKKRRSDVKRIRREKF